MPARSRVAGLPEDIRKELDRRLIGSGFSSYSDLYEWLTGQGYGISRSAIHRHGREVERRIERVRIATEEAKAIEKIVEDGGESVTFSTLVQCQVMLHDIATAAETGDVTAACQQARALADLVRAGISLRRERRKALAEAAGRVDDVARKAGLPEDVEAAIRAAIEGLE